MRPSYTIHGPAHPRISLDSYQSNTGQAENGISQLPYAALPLEEYSELEEDLATHVLDELYPKLFIFSRGQGSHINSLNHHRSNGRQIMATEEAHLHLVWRYDCVFVKRMPESLLRSILDHKQSSGIQITASGIISGFLWSYAFLVRHPLDLILAQESFLLPNTLGWEQWDKFITTFRDLEDSGVANRYKHGQLRLSRLNWAVRIFNPRGTETRWFYALSESSISIYVQAATAPLLFSFAILSLALSAMQVILSTDLSDVGIPELVGTVIGNIFLVFSLGVIFISASIWVLLLAIPSFVLIWQLIWALRHKNKSGVNSPV